VSTAEDRVRGFLATITSAHDVGRTTVVTVDTVPLIQADLVAVLDELAATRAQVVNVQLLAEVVDGDGNEYFGGEVADEIRAALRGEEGRRWAS
jgi:hypothetical protein